MKKRLIFVVVLILLFSSCVYESGGEVGTEEPVATTDTESAEQSMEELSDTTEAPSEFPNEPEDGYSKRY